MNATIQSERKASVVDQIKPPAQQPERKASVADQIKPPPAHVRPTLRLTNPDRLMSFTESLEDDRENRNAPRTPANVRGNRSLLHKVMTIFVIPEIVPLLYSVSSLKATLVWTDPAAESSSSSVLVNDLDLKIWFLGPNVVYPKT